MSKPTAKRERIPPGMVLLQVVINANLRRRFKARCGEAGTTMSAQVEQLARDWLEARKAG
jgi:hypothetical protein